MLASMGSTIDAARAAEERQIRAREVEKRQARFRAWWNRLSPEAQRTEIKAGHVRVNLPSAPEKSRKPRKRTRAAQARSAKVDAMRADHGEAYVHMTPIQRFGVGLRYSLGMASAAIAKRDESQHAASL